MRLIDSQMKSKLFDTVSTRRLQLCLLLVQLFPLFDDVF
jgi:hypothetical protein